MDLALKFPSVYPLIKQGFRRANHLSVGDSSPSPSFGRSLSRTAFNGDRISWPQEKASSSVGRSKKGSVCCKKPSDERSSSSSKLKQEEIISLFRRIQSSISKGDSQGAEEKNRNRDGSSENKPLSKAIIDVLEKPRKITEGVTGVKAEPPKRERNVARPRSNFAKRSPYRPPTTGPIGKLPITKSDKGLEEKDKEEKPPLIETMKLAELKQVAKKRGIKGYSKLKKSEILELLRSS
uniref:SAP-like protein BP-73 n=1 Tax=Noccaea caerulescens TaxID=107243 RepID=A0A1J3HSJ8_NOCCA